MEQSELLRRTSDPDWPPLDEVPAWRKVLTGMALIHWGLLAPALVGLILGTLFLAVIDFRHPDVALMLGFLGMGTIYTLGLAVVCVGLVYCCQVPRGFQGKSLAQATLVLTIATGSLIAITFTLPAWPPPWRHQIRASFGWLLEIMTWSAASVAVLSGLLFVRAVAQHLGEAVLVAQTWRDIVWFCVWIAGLLTLPRLTEFLAIEAPWLRFIFVAWLFGGGATLLVDVTRITAKLRRCIGRALKWAS